MLINLTPHGLAIHAPAGVVTLPPSGSVARVATAAEPLDPADGIPVSRTAYGQIAGLPEPKPGVVYVTSALVAIAARREDVLSPGELIRDAEGKPVGCRGLTRPW
jgi:hypothetical protein